jgi:hypothetical protein
MTGRTVSTASAAHSAWLVLRGEGEESDLRDFLATAGDRLNRISADCAETLADDDKTFLAGLTLVLREIGPAMDADPSQTAPMKLILGKRTKGRKKTVSAEALRGREAVAVYEKYLRQNPGWTQRAEFAAMEATGLARSKLHEWLKAHRKLRPDE